MQNHVNNTYDFAVTWEIAVYQNVSFSSDCSMLTPLGIYSVKNCLPTIFYFFTAWCKLLCPALFLIEKLSRTGTAVSLQTVFSSLTYVISGTSDL